MTDHLGSVMMLLDQEGKKRANYSYDEFGAPHGAVKFNPNWPGPDNIFGFTGQQQDIVGGLLFLRARYYLPEVGRFMSRDLFPGFMSEPLTRNPYAYVTNNPLKFIDPMGTLPWDAKRLIREYQEEILTAGEKYSVDPYLIASVLYNENRLRWDIHDFKDEAGEIITSFGPSDVSIGIGQMTISTAMFI